MTHQPRGNSPSSFDQSQCLLSSFQFTAINLDFLIRLARQPPLLRPTTTSSTTSLQSANQVAACLPSRFLPLPQATFTLRSGTEERSAFHVPLNHPQSSTEDRRMLTHSRFLFTKSSVNHPTERPSIKTDSPLLYEMTSLLRTSASPPMSPHQSSCSNHTAKESTAPREPQRTLKTLYYFTQDSKRTHD
ncbi:hypothetical protein TNCV_4890051 [Trichonephila clavipes]|nr:hypothetical protein TNCV_4890051 [Trichonephila clavipes]